MAQRQRQRDDQIQPIDRYSTNVFYGAGQQQPTSNGANDFGATYSNGQARPVVAAPATSRPVAGVGPAQGNSNANSVRNENWSQDQIVFSSESNDVRNSGASGSVRPVTSVSRSQRGNAHGPAYSDDVRRALDVLLYGRA